MITRRTASGFAFPTHYLRRQAVTWAKVQVSDGFNSIRDYLILALLRDNLLLASISSCLRQMSSRDLFPASYLGSWVSR